VYGHKQDPVAGSRAGDLVKLCNEGHHPALNQMFQAAGTPALEGGGVMGEPPAQDWTCHFSTLSVAIAVCIVPGQQGQWQRGGGPGTVEHLTEPASDFAQLRAVRQCWRR
jgi:hypothetical protein